MTYSDWLDTLVSPISSFVDWLSLVANSLIHNYFFITLLGITLFVSLVWFLFYYIFDIFDNINKKYDDYNDKYYNYKLLKEVQSDYLDHHYDDEFDYRYRSKVLNGQVLNAYLSQNKDLDIDNKRLANLNKIESLKEIKKDILSDDDSSNDEDLNLIIPPKPNLATFDELKYAELHSFRTELENDINSTADRILNDNGFYYNEELKKYVNNNTGEVL